MEQELLDQLGHIPTHTSHHPPHHIDTETGEAVSPCKTVLTTCSNQLVYLLWKVSIFTRRTESHSSARSKLLVGFDQCKVYRSEIETVVKAGINFLENVELNLCGLWLALGLPCLERQLPHTVSLWERIRLN